MFIVLHLFNVSMYSLQSVLCGVLLNCESAMYLHAYTAGFSF